MSIELAVDVLNWLEVGKLGECLVLGDLQVVTIRSLSTFSLLVGHSVVIVQALIHGIICSKRPSHLLGGHVLVSELRVLHQKLLDHLSLQLDIQSHTRLILRAVHLKTGFHFHGRAK